MHGRKQTRSRNYLYARKFYLNNAQWKFIRCNVFYVFEEDNFIYLLSIKNYKFKGNTSPYSVEKQKIKSLIINRNKMKYLEMIENELIQNGKISNNIKIY